MGAGGGLRITGGALRGRVVEVPPGLAVRPMRTRLRAALFQMLGDHVPRARLLDVFSGSGAISIEALSRGAAHAVVIEKSPAVLAVLRRNLQLLGLIGRTTLAALDPYHQPVPDGPYDLIVLDPPFPHYREALAIPPGRDPRGLRDPRDREAVDPDAVDPEALDPEAHVRGPRARDPRLPDPRLPDPRLPDPRLPDPRLPDPRLRDPWSLAFRLAETHLSVGGLLAMEHPADLTPPPVPAGLACRRARTYGETALIVWQKQP